MGHHEIFHVFVLLGSLAHFLSVYCYVFNKKTPHNKNYVAFFLLLIGIVYVIKLLWDKM